MPATDAESYRPIMPLAEWAETKIDTSQLDIDYAHFSFNFNTLESDAQNALVRQVLRESAAESGALEDLYTLKSGESRTIATEAAGWESILGDNEKAESRRSFEDLVSALENAVRSVEDGRPITLTLIRETHTLACASQGTFEATALINNKPTRIEKKLNLGQFKQEPNIVRTRSGSVHTYCPPESVQAEMDRFCEEIKSELADHVNPIIKSAYIHYCLSQIHPFEDGNGRVSRIISSMILMQSYQIPLIVYSDRKQTYLQALEAVERKDYRELSQNIVDRITATLSELTQIIKYSKESPSEEQLSKLMQLVNDHSEVDLVDITEISQRLYTEFAHEFESKINEIVSESQGALTVDFGSSSHYPLTNSSPSYSPKDPDGLPAVPLDYFFQTPRTASLFLVKDEKRTDIQSYMMYSIGQSSDKNNNFPLALVATPLHSVDEESRIGCIHLRIEDCSPSTGTNITSRMKTLVDTACKFMLSELERKATERLHQSGSLLRNQQVNTNL